MAEIIGFEKILWATTILLAIGLAAMVVSRKNHKAYPVFFAYILAMLAQNLIFALSYRLWGFGSAVSFKIAWASQSVVIAARALAVAEICRRILAKYSGIWALGWRIFLAAGFVLLAYAWAVGGHNWRLVTLTAHRSLELGMAVAILALFVFAHYYQVVVEPAARFLAIGFFLYSCFQVLNDTILERWLTHYATLWNLIGTLTFLASLLLWTWALRLTQQHMVSEPELLPEDHYRSLSPGINARLKSLNERLSHFWGAEEERT